MVYGGAINSFIGFTNRTDQQEGNGIDGAHLRTPELICPKQMTVKRTADSAFGRDGTCQVQHIFRFLSLVRRYGESLLDKSKHVIGLQIKTGRGIIRCNYMMDVNDVEKMCSRIRIWYR